MVNMTDATSAYDPQFVGLQFAKQYYTVLSKKPAQVHLFYKPASIFVHGEENLTSAEANAGQGEEDFNKYIESLKIETCSTSITRIDAQSLPAGSILVMVTGRMARNEDVARLFVQTFVLAPQDRGFYVHNDIFRFLCVQEDGPARMDYGTDHTVGIGEEAPKTRNNQINGAYPASEISKGDAIEANSTDTPALTDTVENMSVESASLVIASPTADEGTINSGNTPHEAGVIEDVATTQDAGENSNTESSAATNGQAVSFQTAPASLIVDGKSETTGNQSDKREKRASTPSGVKSTTLGPSIPSVKANGSMHTSKSGQKAKGGSKQQNGAANTSTGKSTALSAQTGTLDPVSSIASSGPMENKSNAAAVPSKPAVPEAPKTFAQMAQLAAQKKQSAELPPRAAQQSQAKVSPGGPVGTGSTGKHQNSGNNNQHHNQHAQRKHSDGQSRSNMSNERNNNSGRPNSSRNGERANNNGTNGNRNNKAVRSNGIFISGVPAAVADDVIRRTFGIIPAPMRVEKCERNLEKRIAFVYFNNPEAVKWVLNNGPWKIDGNPVLIDERKEKARR